MLIIALGIPLTITLQRRATAELENRALIQAQGIAAAVGTENLDRPQRLDSIVIQAADQVGGRVVVVDDDGTLLADSDGPAELGTGFATAGRPEILRALEGTPTSDIRDSADLGHDIMATAVPIRDETGLLGAVRITQSVQEVNDHVRNVTVGLLAIGLALLVAGLVLAFALARTISRPLTRLAAAAKRLGAGDLSVRAGDIRGATEIQDLGHSFDEMADRMERSVRAQREFVANASHQLRTPLTGMKLRLEAALASTTDPQMRRTLDAADREVDRLSEIVARLLEMAREIERGEPTTVDLDQAVARAVERWHERAERQEASLRTEPQGGVGQGDPTDVDQILDNLIDNAITYAPGEITLGTGREDGQVMISVRDRGPGISEEELERVTERFYRGRTAPSGGSGLGLAIARDLAEKWGGTLSVENDRGGGMRVEVRLRAAGAS